MSCRSSLKYLIYNRFLCEFTHNLTINSFTDIGLRKYELGRFNSETCSELCQTSKKEHFAKTYLIALSR